ncbi:hypothetical protein [Streptomyces aidingensis]|uniref:Integral membrane protein n=1 Tax=Streptomyces aidingensis TaxID=910347 RepID=A0A1I1RSU8_9ACTN|nr:hypothetical protein [Streptomyces aidingensis]SFD35288.1 hypothetical protein SAMN05421773_113170 [Streptomyces aidingensis]
MSEKAAAPKGPENRPAHTAAAAVLTGLEGLAAAGLGVLMLVLVVTGDPDGVAQAVTGAVTVLALAAIPLAAASGLWRLRRWARGPAVLVQILCLPIGFELLAQGGLLRAAGLALMAAAVTALVCLFSARTTRALGTAAPGRPA